MSKEINELIKVIDSAIISSITKSELEVILMKIKFIEEPIIKNTLLNKVKNIKII